MKSILFNKIDVTREEEFTKEKFKSDISLLLDISDDNLKEFLLAYKTLLLTKITREREKIKEILLQKLQIEEKDYAKTYSITDFFFKIFIPDSDTYQEESKNIVDDLLEIGIIESNKSKKLLTYIESIKRLAQEDLNLEIRRIKTLSKGSPIFKSGSSAVNFRAIFDNEGEFGETAENYKPKCLGVVPLIQLSITLENYSQSTVCFQIDKERLLYLKNMIEQTIIETAEAQKFLNLEVS